MGDKPSRHMRELVYWGAFISAAIMAHFVMAALGFGVDWRGGGLRSLIRLGVMIAAGVGCGFLMETVYTMRSPGPPGSGDGGPMEQSDRR